MEPATDSLPAHPPPPAFGTPVLQAALFSAIIPGLGHLFVQRKREAIILLTLFIVALILFWPLRLPVNDTGLLISIWSVSGLCLWSGCSALLAGKNPDERISKWWLLIAVPVALLAAAFHAQWATRAAGFHVVEIISRSMENTIRPGERVMTDLRAYRHAAPVAGDIVSYRWNHRAYTARVIAIKGDTLLEKDGGGFVNGNQIVEPYAHHKFGAPAGWTRDLGPVTIPSGKIFVMGDNRDLSLDSRAPDVGAVNVSDVTGRLLYTVGGFFNPDSRPVR